MPMYISVAYHKNIDQLSYKLYKYNIQQSHDILIDRQVPKCVQKQKNGSNPNVFKSKKTEVMTIIWS